MAKKKSQAKKSSKSRKTRKKSTKKSSVKKKTKKSPRKKKSSKVEVKISRKVPGKAPEEYAFVLKDGKRLRSLQELSNALETMNEDIWEHHVNDMKNDFATWVNDIFDDSDLAEDLKKTRSRIETRIKLLQKMVDNVIKEGKKKSK